MVRYPDQRVLVGYVDHHRFPLTSYIYGPSFSTGLRVYYYPPPPTNPSVNGVTFVSMKTHSFMYFTLAILGSVLRLATVGCEDFHGHITNSWQVRAYDSMVEAVLFGLIVWQAQCACRPRS